MRKTIWIALFGLFGIGLISCENDPETPVDPLFEQQVFAVSEWMFHRFLFEINLSFYKGLEANGLVDNFILTPAEVDCSNTTYNWNAVTKTLTIDYGQSCQPSTGFVKSGRMVVSIPSGVWAPGSIANLRLEDLSLAQRKFNGDIKIEHGNFVFGDSFRQKISYEFLTFIHEDNKLSTVFGEFEGVNTRNEGYLVSLELSGNGAGNYKGIQNFGSFVQTPLVHSVACRDLVNNGFAKGILESNFGDFVIFSSPGIGPDCSTELTIRIGDQIRSFPF